VQADVFYWCTKAGTVIVDEHINLAEFLQCTLCHTGHLVGVAHIHREGQGAFTESAYSLSRRFQMLQAPTTEHDVSTGTRTFKSASGAGSAGSTIRRRPTWAPPPGASIRSPAP